MLTVDSHRQFPGLTNSDQLSDEVIRGQDVWHANNCINCHTILGEGAYYAPDLTKITQMRGAPYLTAFLKDPSQFYDEERHRRLMPNPNLDDDEISDLIAFMDWVANVDNQNWPPRPILVKGTSLPGADLSVAQQADKGEELPPGATPVSAGKDPVALGEVVFRSATPACTACHSIAPDVNMAGPTLAGLADRAEDIIDSSDYEGNAATAEEFIHESIVAPSAYLHPGEMYSAEGKSFMPATYGETLSSEELEHLVAYLASIK